jgi:hypothetical protein
MVFDETDCDCMERALVRAYRLFMSSGRLCTANLSIASATLSRAIMHAMMRGERDEARLAMYAVNTFNTYSDEIVSRDLMSLRGETSGRVRHEAGGSDQPAAARRATNAVRN